MAAALAPKHPLQEEDESDGAMGFLEHLEELRVRIIRSAIALGVGMVVAFAFHDRLASFVLAPIRQRLPPGSSLIFTRPGEGFSFHFDVALIAGAICAAPYIMYQVWLFIAPGLYATEKRFAIPFVVLTTAGAVGGAAFSHYIVFPYMMVFFGSFSSADFAVFMPSIEYSFELYIKMLVGMTIVFQLPTVVFFLAKMRLVTARFLWRNIKYAILIIFIVAAVLTPSADPWNQIVFATPMMGLYLLSIGIAWLVAPKTTPSSSLNSDAPMVLLFEVARRELRREQNMVPGRWNRRR